jgi:phage tail P2-like protein
MKMSKGITQESMLSVLPGVLARDNGMYSLAKLIGWITGENAEEVDSPAIFQRIDELDEDLLDILAKDYKIDWYDFDADIETKRRQIKNNWRVRKGLGTVKAVKTALQDVWRDTTVEEWFEYDGEPGYFRVLLSTDTSGSINFSKAVRMIDIFKPVRAHVDGYPILRIRCGIVIHTKKSQNIKYDVPVAGTVPQYSTHGDKSYEDIVIETEAAGPKYLVPVTGQVTAGTHPDYATHGDVDGGALEVGASSVSASYGIRRCGTPIDSLF